jgi:hypothetical protein
MPEPWTLKRCCTINCCFFSRQNRYHLHLNVSWRKLSHYRPERMLVEAGLIILYVTFVTPCTALEAIRWKFEYFDTPLRNMYIPQYWLEVFDAYPGDLVDRTFWLFGLACSRSRLLLSFGFLAHVCVNHHIFIMVEEIIFSEITH